MTFCGKRNIGSTPPHGTDVSAVEVCVQVTALWQADRQSNDTCFTACCIDSFLISYEWKKISWTA